MAESDWQRLKPYIQQYDVLVEDVEPLGSNRFLLKGPNRAYEGRFVSPKSGILRSVVGDYLARRRFRAVQRFRQNLYHDRMVPVDDRTSFYMTDVCQGAPLTVTPDDVHAGVDNLIALHRAFDGAFEALRDETQEGEENRLTRYGSWEKAFHRGVNWLKTERMLTRDKDESPQDAMWQDWLARWEDLAQTALSRLQSAGYADIAEESRLKQRMAWNEYRISNLRRHGNGRIFTAQMGDPQFDDSLYDLATLCQDVAYAGHRDGVNAAIEKYSEAYPLSPEQKMVVKAFCAFPHHAQILGHQMRTGRMSLASVPAAEKRWELHYHAATSLLQ